MFTTVLVDSNSCAVDLSAFMNMKTSFKDTINFSTFNANI